MNIKVSVGGVDGETEMDITTKVPSSALKFLEHFDHEGSSVTVNVHCDGAEEGYRLLEKLKDKE